MQCDGTPTSLDPSLHIPQSEGGVEGVEDRVRRVGLKCWVWFADCRGAGCMIGGEGGSVYCRVCAVRCVLWNMV